MVLGPFPSLAFPPKVRISEWCTSRSAIAMATGLNRPIFRVSKGPSRCIRVASFADDVGEQVRILLAKGKITQLATTRKPGKGSHRNGFNSQFGFENVPADFTISQEKESVSKKMNKKILFCNKYLRK